MLGVCARACEQVILLIVARNASIHLLLSARVSFKWECTGHRLCITLSWSELCTWGSHLNEIFCWRLCWTRKNKLVVAVNHILQGSQKLWSQDYLRCVPTKHLIHFFLLNRRFSFFFLCFLSDRVWFSFSMGCAFSVEQSVCLPKRRNHSALWLLTSAKWNDIVLVF